MIIRRTSDVRPSEITPEAVYRERRRWLQAAAVAGKLKHIHEVIETHEDSKAIGTTEKAHRRKAAISLPITV